MDEGLDTGDILAEQEFGLPTKITAGELHDKTAVIGAEMVLEILADIENIEPRSQTDEGAMYAKKINKDEARIDWNLSAVEIERLVRGLNPYPGAYFEYEGKKTKVFECDLVEMQGKPGEVLDDKIAIACGEGAVRVTQLQKPGKKPMSAEEFLRGNMIDEGELLL